MAEYNGLASGADIDAISGLKGKLNTASISGAEFTDKMVDLSGVASSASDIDNMVSNGATQADLGALALGSGNLTASQVETIAELGSMSSSSKDIDNVVYTNNNSFTVGKNLYNPIYNETGYYILNTNGSKIANVDQTTSEYIEIEPSAFYSFQTTNKWTNFYDENKIWISGLNNAVSFTSPSNAKFVRIGGTNDYMLTSIQLEKGVKTSYEKYTKLLKADNVFGLKDTILSNVLENNFKQGTIGNNLYNYKTSINDFRVIPGAGTLLSAVGYSTSAFIEVEGSTNYVAKNCTFSAFYDENYKFIFSPASLLTSFVSPINAKYFRFSSGTAQMDFNSRNQFVQADALPEFEFFENKIPYHSLKVLNTPNVITASLDGNTDFVGRRAIQDAIDSITDATPDNRYEIRVSNGIYTATTLEQFDKEQRCFIQAKDFVDVVGESKEGVIIYGELPDNLGSGFAYGNWQPVYWKANDSHLVNATVIAKNCRYPIHIDSSPKNNKQYLTNVKVSHYGNYGDAVVSTSWNPIGLGTMSGQEVKIEGCELAYVSNHNNTDFSKPSIVHFNNCNITGRGDNKTFTELISVSSIGSGVRDKFIVSNCSLAPNIEVNYSGTNNSLLLSNQPSDRSEIDLIMRDVIPRAVNNSGVTGAGLRVKSKTKGTTSKVRFDETSSAFQFIISNSLHSVVLENKYHRKTINGYQFFDGGQNLEGYAVGALGISEDKSFAKLGARLGDCSTINKTLGVYIDDVLYNVVFNTNLTAATNASVLSLINAVISSVATASEYCVGKDYYPEFKWVFPKTNADTTEILAGMGIVFIDSQTIRKALNSDNRIDGIALDNCIVGGKTRVITKGQIYSSGTLQRFSINETASGVRNIGTALGISTTEAGKFTVGVSPAVLKAVNTNILEII